MLWKGYKELFQLNFIQKFKWVSSSLWARTVIWDASAQCVEDNVIQNIVGNYMVSKPQRVGSMYSDYAF